MSRVLFVKLLLVLSETYTNTRDTASGYLSIYITCQLIWDPDYLLLLFKVEENRKYRVHINGDLMFKSEYLKSRSVFGSVELKKGRYVLLATTKEPGETGQFMLRLFTSSPASSK